MNKIEIIKDPSILREGIMNIIYTVFPHIDIFPYSALEHQHLFKQDNIGDLALIDAEADIDLLQVIESCQERNTKVIVWISKPPTDALLELFKLKLQGYFFVDMSKTEFIYALTRVIEGYHYIHPELSAILLEEYYRMNNPSEKKPSKLLTEREWEVLEFLTTGTNNDQIAKQLKISPSTVRNHISSILRKLNVPNRTNAVSIALRKGWFKRIAN